MDNAIDIVNKYTTQNCKSFFECNNWMPTAVGIAAVATLYAISFLITTVFEKPGANFSQNQSEEYFYENSEIYTNKINIKKMD